MFTPVLWIVKVANLGVVVQSTILIPSGEIFTLVVFFLLSLDAFHNFYLEMFISDRFLASVKRSQVCWKKSDQEPPLYLATFSFLMF